MVRIIENPRIIPAAGSPPKRIEEYVGRIVSGTSGVSIARMVSPSGWSEPFQTPEFDEYTLVLSGALHIEIDSEICVIYAGQAAIVPSGSKVRYSTPEGAEYVAVCLPAFSADLVHREEIPKDSIITGTPQTDRYNIHAAGPEEIDRIEDLWGLLRECIIPRNQMFKNQMRKLRFIDRKEDILDKNQGRTVRIFFAVDTKNGEDTGYCLCSAARGSYGEVESIYIKEDARNLGIGTTLMVHAISWMKEQGSEDIRVHVTVGNEDVMHFYQKFGLYPRQYILSHPEGL